MTLIRTLIAATLVSASALASAAPVSITFEGAADNGNHLALNALYQDLGISFNDRGFTRIDSDNGGSLSVANVPSPSTVLQLHRDGNNAGVSVGLVINVANGFSKEFSMWYSTIQTNMGSIQLYSELNAIAGDEITSAGAELANLGGTTCTVTGNDTGQFCNWAKTAISFEGVAKSIRIVGRDSQYLLDSLYFGEIGGTDVPPGTLPEPSSYALMALAALAMTAATRRGRAAKR